MNYLVYFYILIVVLCWTFNPFIKKVLLTKIGKPEYMVLNHLFCTLFILLYFLYMFSHNKCDLACIKSLSKKDLSLLTLEVLLLLYLVPLCYYTLYQTLKYHMRTHSTNRYFVNFSTWLFSI